MEINYTIEKFTGNGWVPVDESSSLADVVTNYVNLLLNGDGLIRIVEVRHSVICDFDPIGLTLSSERKKWLSK